MEDARVSSFAPWLRLRNKYLEGRRERRERKGTQSLFIFILYRNLGLKSEKVYRFLKKRKCKKKCVCMDCKVTLPLIAISYDYRSCFQDHLDFSDLCIHEYRNICDF